MTDKLAAIRAERLSRNGRPFRPTPHLTWRCVMASLALEGIRVALPEPEKP